MVEYVIWRRWILSAEEFSKTSSFLHNEIPLLIYYPGLDEMDVVITKNDVLKLGY